MRDFSRETSLNEQFEFLIFRIQKSRGKVFSSTLIKLMSLFSVFRRGWDILKLRIIIKDYLIYIEINCKWNTLSII